MEKSENSFKPPKQEIKNPEKLTREKVTRRIERGESLENLNLADIELAGLNFEGKSFRGSDIRGIRLYREERSADGTLVEIRTNIRDANFIDATIADLGPEVFFGRVEAEGAIFGHTENLLDRRGRHKEYKESGRIPGAKDTGELLNFNGSEGNFKKTTWLNADFGGGSGYEAIFSGANLSEAEIIGSDLAGIDFSTTKVDGIKIIDPISLSGMKINAEQADFVAEAVQLTNPKEQAEFLKKKEAKGARKALEDYFGIVVVEIKD